MNHVFAQVPQIKCPRSVFRRPFTLKTTIGADYLYPIYCDEVLPGDTFNCKFRVFGRLTTPIVPFMDDLYLDTFFFAVPIRLIDSNWKKIMGESVVTNPMQDTFPEQFCPQLSITSSQASVHSLHDYLGLPIKVNMQVLPYWHRAYNFIYNECFRDENLLSYVKVGGNTPTSTGAESADDYTLKRRCKVHDYFTSCLPWPNKGQPAMVPIGSSAPVYGDDSPLRMLAKYRSGNYAEPYAYHPVQMFSTNMDSGRQTGDMIIKPITDGISGSEDTPQTLKVITKSELDTHNDIHGTFLTSGLMADLSDAQGVTVNILREAIAVQHFMETSARSGTRYIETILGHFNVVSPDARMQRPEYLGGSSQPMNVSSVPQTSATNDTTPQGNLAAFVTGGSKGFWYKTFTEHCVILGLANIRAINCYQQGIPRMFSRKTKYDFYWPEFANLGEQAVLNKEIYAQGTSADNGVFGYQERWAEYRYHPNMITSALRSTATQSLDYWHLSQKFASLPALGPEFIQSITPIDRVSALTTNVHEQFILDGYFDVECARPMPLYSVPGLNRL